jgi:hypothetical protein
MNRAHAIYETHDEYINIDLFMCVYCVFMESRHELCSVMQSQHAKYIVCVYKSGV